MNENSVCPIWGTVATVSSGVNLLDRFGDDVDSPRAGGEYFISNDAKSLVERKDERFKARLTSWLIEQRVEQKKETQRPKITPQTIIEIKKRRDLRNYERADKLLRYINEATTAIGEQVAFREAKHDKINAGLNNLHDISDGYLTRYRMMAWSECTRSFRFGEVEFLLEHLHRNNLIEYDAQNESCKLTVEGSTHLDELEEVAIDSSQAFVAMWFDDSMKCALENGIKLGIREAGYEPLPINEKMHINKIDDEIIAEIKRSRFVVADFTHKEIKKCMKKKERKKAGARGSVYYEAGFAHALDIPVIFTCRKDLIKKVHFDTRQYNHITWEPEKLPELRKALTKCIVEVIGRGPGKMQDPG